MVGMKTEAKLEETRKQFADDALRIAYEAHVALIKARCKFEGTVDRLRGGDGSKHTCVADPKGYGLWKDGQLTIEPFEYVGCSASA